jgi:hypothetical protein
MPSLIVRHPFMLHPQLVEDAHCPKCSTSNAYRTQGIQTLPSVLVRFQVASQACNRATAASFPRVLRFIRTVLMHANRAQIVGMPPEARDGATATLRSAGPAPETFPARNLENVSGDAETSRQATAAARTASYTLVVCTQLP